MKEENILKFKSLIKEYLENKSLFLYKEIWSSVYGFNKTKGDRNEYSITQFVEKFSLGTKKEEENYKIWKYIYQKDISLAYEIVLNHVAYPSQDYSRKEYIESILNLYTNNKKENKILWSIVNTKVFLNNNILIVKSLFEEGVFSNIQKKQIIEHYLNTIEKNKKFDTLDNKRIITILNEKLIKPIEIELIKEKELEIETKTLNCVYFEITVKELMGYSLSLSSQHAENLLTTFSKLLPKVVEAETTDILERKNKDLESYQYAVLTKLDEKIIKKIFNFFTDAYIKTIDNKVRTDDEMLDCLKFAVIKARKENLENNLTMKNNKSTINKI